MVDTREALIYDGECAWCTHWAEWVSRRSCGVDIDSARDWSSRARSVTLTGDELARSAWWIDADQRVEGARAISRALTRTSGAWAAVGRVLASPRVVPHADRLYRVLARHRYLHRRRDVRAGGPTPHHAPARPRDGGA